MTPEHLWIAFIWMWLVVVVLWTIGHEIRNTIRHYFEQYAKFIHDVGAEVVDDQFNKKEPN